jgi:GWxTD domain-containing protein
LSTEYNDTDHIDEKYDNEFEIDEETEEEIHRTIVDDLRSIFDFISPQRRTLSAKTELLRFLNEEGQTEFHLNIKIPNNELHFIHETQGWVSHLDIRFNLYHDGQVVSENRFNHFAAARSVAVAQSANHYVLEKIDFVLDGEGFTASIDIRDRNASTQYNNRFDLILLDPNSLISDIEISHGLSTDLIDALDRFQRGQFQFYVDPIPVIDGSNRDFVIYYQVSNISPNIDTLYVFYEKIKILRSEEIIWENEFFQMVNSMPYPVAKRIPLGDWDPGLYSIEVTIVDPRADRSETTARYFSLSRSYQTISHRVFSCDDDEFALISFFLDSRERRLWRGLSEQGRKNFIESFWSRNNPNPGTEENLFLSSVRLRVNEANWRFSHHREGWRSDRGRIFIKHGNPDTIDRRETDQNSRYSRKNYHIWRYHGSGRNYVFLDFQGNGNFRLILARNDFSENSDPHWMSFIFDPGVDDSRIDF